MTRNAARTALLATTAAVLLPLTACGIEHGTVTGKEYIAAYTDWDPIPITRTRCSGSGKQSSCQTVTVGYRSVPEYHPACWELQLRNAHGDTGEVCVSHSEYATTKTGDQR